MNNIDNPWKENNISDKEEDDEDINADGSIDEECEAEMQMLEAEMPHNQIKDILEEMQLDIKETLQEIKDEQEANTDLIIKIIWEATKLINTLIICGGIALVGYVLIEAIKKYFN